MDIHKWKRRVFVGLWASIMLLGSLYWWSRPLSISSTIVKYNHCDGRDNNHTPKYSSYNIAVFGGSTSTGEGTSSYEHSWPEVMRREIELTTGAKITVSNFARGATGADYFSTCFLRFVSQSYDIVLLEFAINGGNVTALVDQVRASMSTNIFLVKLMSCKSSTGKLLERPSLLRFGEGQQDAAFARRLVEFDFLNNITSQFGSPCSAKSMKQLFDPGHHHLGDLGHQLLGSFVADQLLHNYFGNTAHQKGQLLEQKTPEKCFFGDAGITSNCSNSLCSIKEEFVSKDGSWAFTSEKEGREDKICWQTSVDGAVLESKKPWKFTSLTIFAERTADKTGNIEVFCGEQRLAKLKTYRSKFALVEMLPRIEKQCYGKLVKFRNVHTSRTRQMARICGLVFDASNSRGTGGNAA